MILNPQFQEKSFNSKPKISLQPQSQKPHYVENDFKFIQIPEVRLTEDFMNDPYKLIDNLHAKNYQKIGIVKLIPPENSMVSDIRNLRTLQDKLKSRKFQTRVQVLNNLLKGEPFGNNQEGFTLKEYADYAQQFSGTYKSQITRVSQSDEIQDELEFWSIVDNPDEYEEVEVEYAADLLVTKFTSGFEEKGKVSFNLNNINNLANGMFQVLKTQSELSGITIPWLYFGMKYACFCWHYEDLFLSSVNYMHFGSPKTWYAIPPSHQERFEELFQQKYKQQLKSNPKLLHDIICMISPVELMKNNIKVLKTIQYPGEIILTIGATFHAGFSHGLNCSEAVNIAPTQWLEEYDKAVSIYRQQGNYKKVSFPITWLLIKFFKIPSKISNNFDKIISQYKMREKLSQYVNRELNFRNSIIKLYGENVKMIEFANQSEKYDRNTCKVCKDYMYMSFMFCKKQERIYIKNYESCLTKGCLDHQSLCICCPPKLSLYIRYTKKELQEFLGNLDKLIERKGDK